MKNKNSIYLLLTILLVILSTIGGYFLFKMYQDRNLTIYTSSSIPKIELIPTDSIQSSLQDASTSSSIITPTVIPVVTITVATATATPQNNTPTTIELVSTPSPSPVLTSTVFPISPINVIPFQSKEDGFSVSYSNQRQLHQDTEASGNRYTFTNKSGNFAIHVSPSGKWSWTHPDRQFTNSLVVSGQNTFRYDINAQTIIDLQSGDKNYTIQCIHNGIESLKTECDQFVSSFKLL